MNKFCFAIILIACCTFELEAHDTFLKFESHFLQTKTKAKVLLINGTFESSESSVALNRMQDVRITGPNGFLQRPDHNQWRLTEKLNELSIKTGDSGTYVVGVSIKPRTFNMTAKKFDSYLKHAGLLDMIKSRQSGQQKKSDVTEKYSKHVKAIFQVGEAHTESFGQPHDFPIEIVPIKNPFSLNVGETLPVKVMLDGKPLTNQLVYASYAGFHKHGDDGQHIEAVSTRTNKNGIAEFKIATKGNWYVRLIHMVPSDEEGVDVESKWATLTFEMK
jgi:uncharacterized GH25 family protein